VTRVVVAGHGMVGARFVDELMAADTAGRFDVTVLGAEACEPYNRVLLSEVVSGAHDLASVTLPSASHPRVRVHRGIEAIEVDREDQVVLTDAGTRHRYDFLILATGSAARIPPLGGLHDGDTLLRGVHPLRTIDDARDIVAATRNARNAVVLGGGVLGLEVACGLARRGLAVTVVHPMAVVMERQLDDTASRVVEQAMVGLGIAYRVGIAATDCVGTDGHLTGVRLVDGELVPAELLVLATGTTPATALATSAGLPTARGVLVTDTLASPADSRVFAIGDCAQPPEGGSGLVAQGWEQSRRLVSHLTGTTGGTTGGPTPADTSDVVRLKAHGLDVVTMGVCGSAAADDASRRRLLLSDSAAGRHVEVVVSNGCLVGARCIGAGPVAADLLATYTRRIPVPADPAYLLLPALAGAVPGDGSVSIDTTVCRCNGVTRGAIEDAVTGGADSVEEVAAATRATTGCGGCRDEVCGLVAALAHAQARSTPVRTA